MFNSARNDYSELNNQPTQIPGPNACLNDCLNDNANNHFSYFLIFQGNNCRIHLKNFFRSNYF